MPRGRPQRSRTLNFSRRRHEENPVHSKDNEQDEEKLYAPVKDNIRKRSCSTESTTEGSENHHEEQNQDMVVADSEQRDCLESDDVNSEVKISNIKEKDVTESKNNEEWNSEKSDATLDDRSFTLNSFRRKRNLRKWSDEEKEITEKFFRRHIKLKISPKKREVLQLMNLNPKLFKDRKWDVIKVYVCNKYNSKSNKGDDMSFVSVQSKRNNDPLLGENTSEEIKSKEKLKKKVTSSADSVDEKSTFLKLHPKKVICQKSTTLLESKVMPASGKYLAVLKQLPQSGEVVPEKRYLQNSQTGDNIVLKRLVFDAEKRCFRVVDSNELVNAMSKKIRVLSVNQEGIGKGISTLNVLQKVPPSIDEAEGLRKQSSSVEDILPVSTDDMCVLCARKKSPTHNINHLVNLIKDIAGVNLTNLNLPLRACEECVAEVNVTLKLRNSIKKAYEDLIRKDDTLTINVLPPKSIRQNETDTSTAVIEKSPEENQESVKISGDDSGVMGPSHEHNSDGLKRIKLDNCGQNRVSCDNYSNYHMGTETEKICEQLCITNISQKEHLRECKRTDVICKVCNRSFRCLQNLRWHMRCHVYRCEVCCKTFVYSVAKKNHLEKDHTEQEVQKALNDIKTNREKLKFIVPHSHSTPHIAALNTKKDGEIEVKVEEIVVKEEIIENKIKGVKEEVVL